MNFREAMDHYRADTASEEERKLVEQELEKMQLLEEYMDERWNDSIRSGTEDREDADFAASELKNVRRSLRCRAARIVLISLVLTAVLLLSIFYVVIPAAEKQYLDPETNTFDCPFDTDLELALAAYSELFVPDQAILSLSSSRTGFASYNLTIQYFDPARWRDTRHVSARLEKNQLTIPADMLMTSPSNIFERGCFGFGAFGEEFNEDVYHRLSQLPEYVKVYAAVSFPEDLTMEELIEFSDSLKDGEVCWIGVRHVEENRQLLPLCGIYPFSGGKIRENINNAYPMFEIKGSEMTGDNLRQHFQSLLKYMADWTDDEIQVGDITKTYYEEVLDYVEENGVHTYGCYVTASPKTILGLLDSGEITQAYLADARLDF